MSGEERTVVPIGEGMNPDWTRAAATTMHIDCRRSDKESVRREEGRKRRVWAKKMQPRRKKRMDMSDFIHPCGWDAG